MGQQSLHEPVEASDVQGLPVWGCGCEHVLWSCWFLNVSFDPSIQVFFTDVQEALTIRSDQRQ